jgi:hypothetical protein
LRTVHVPGGTISALDGTVPVLVPDGAIPALGVTFLVPRGTVPVSGVTVILFAMNFPVSSRTVLGPGEIDPVTGCSCASQNYSCRNVVLARRTIDLGCWEFGMGREWEGVEEGEVSSQATWDQGGGDHATQREGFQVSERGIKRESKGNQRGIKGGTSKVSKKMGLRRVYIVNLYMCI